MATVVIYSSAHCPYCVMAKRLLEQKGVNYTEIRVDLEPEKRQEMIQKSQRRTVPQIFINGESIGGYTDLVAIYQANRLDSLLSQPSI